MILRLFLLLTLLFPKGGSAMDPAFGNSAFPQSETVGQAGENFDFRSSAVGADGLYATLHGVGRSNPVAGADAVIGRGFVAVDFRQTGVLHNHSCRTGAGLFTEGFCTEGTQSGCHAGAGGTAPEGIVGRINLQFAGVSMDKGDGPGQIFTGLLRIGAVNQSESVVIFPG